MKRRTFLSAATAFFAPHVHASAAAWRARFLDGGFDGSAYWSGLAIDMEDGWKTYWRVPGDGGVPPQIDVAGVNLKSAEVFYPLPERFSDESGKSIGYKGQVVFPVKLVPLDPAAPLEIEMSAFFGVCEVVCIPARSEATLRLAMGTNASRDAPLLTTWRGKVPVMASDGPVRAAIAVALEGKPALRLEVSSAIDDVFISGPEKYYFHAPVLGNSSATSAISGAAASDELKGQTLRIVSVMQGRGLEQEIVVQ